MQGASLRCLQLRVSVAGELPPQLAAGVVQRLVERATRGAETLGENVDRHPVDGEGDEDAALVWREGELDGVLDRGQQLRLLRRLVGLEAGTRDEIPTPPPSAPRAPARLAAAT